MVRHRTAPSGPEPADGLELPDCLATPRAKLVYLYLQASGGGSVEEMADRLDCGKLSLLAILRELTRRDLVAHADGEYVARSGSAS